MLQRLKGVGQQDYRSNLGNGNHPQSVYISGSRMRAGLRVRQASQVNDRESVPMTLSEYPRRPEFSAGASDPFSAGVHRAFYLSGLDVTETPDLSARLESTRRTALGIPGR